MDKARKILRIALVIMLAIALFLSAMSVIARWKFTYYDLKVAEFGRENMHVTYSQVVFVGDSITDYCDLAKFYPNIFAYNRGISADTTSGLLKRMKESVYDLKPNLVVLLIGINDMAFYHKSNDEILSNTEVIINNIKEKCPYTKIIVQSLYPVTTWQYKEISERCTDRIVEYNPRLKELAERLSCTYVDIYSALLDDDGKTFNMEYSKDGLHPNAKGYEVISAKLRPVIKSHLG